MFVGAGCHRDGGGWFVSTLTCEPLMYVGQFAPTVLITALDQALVHRVRHKICQFVSVCSFACGRHVMCLLRPDNNIVPFPGMLIRRINLQTKHTHTVYNNLSFKLTLSKIVHTIVKRWQHEYIIFDTYKISYFLDDLVGVIRTNTRRQSILTSIMGNTLCTVHRRSYSVGFEYPELTTTAGPGLPDSSMYLWAIAVG